MIEKELQSRFSEMCKTGHLFVSSISGEQVWAAYLMGFGGDPIFRINKVHECNACKHFITHYGNIIAFDSDLNLMTVWDNVVDQEYVESARLIKNRLAKGKIAHVFVMTYDYLNTKANYERVNMRQPSYLLGIEKNLKQYTKEDVEAYPNASIKVGDIKTFTHLHIRLPKAFVNSGDESREAISGKIDSQVKVFKRGLEEISLNTLELIKDLEEQGSLLNGISYRHFITGAIAAKKEYDKAPNKDAYVWIKAQELGAVAGFRNTAIGTLMVDLEGGANLEESVKAFNKMVDPANYMKATAPITKAQIERAEKFVEEKGYVDSFDRRVAKPEDINVQDILHTETSTKEVKSRLSVFSNIKPTTVNKVKIPTNIQEMKIDDFMKNILPGCTSVEAFLENRLKGNFVNLLTSKNKKSKCMFKWNNNFSWTYTGNLTGKSQIAKTVKKLGGYVDAPFRASIIWNESGEAPHMDFDIHCIEDGRDEIYYGRHHIHTDMNLYDTYKTQKGGVLDLDIVDPTEQCKATNYVAVENIFYKSIPDGKFRFFINDFNGNTNQGARAEIYIDGTIYSYRFPNTFKHNESRDIATVYIKDGKVERIEHNQNAFVGINGDQTSQKMFGLDSCEFQHVNLVCLSPNYWDGQGVGNKHYFFMLQGAKNPESIRSIHNEFLNDELKSQRKVMEVLGATLKVPSEDGQLCGLGFNATVRDSLIVRIDGKRLIKIKF